MTKVKAIETTDGQIFKDIDAAKRHEIEIVLQASPPKGPGTDMLSEAIMESAEKILNILTMKASSHPAARKSNGATRKPRVTKAATTEGAA